MTARRTWTARRRLAVFERDGGVCHICGRKILVGEAWELEHRVPLALGGPDDESNVHPAHVTCHRAKSAKDAANLAKVNRVRAKHVGAAPKAKRRLPGAKGSGWKAKIGGGWERRE
jgi:5-methylcytosine-specific restriction endonuclease McrA